MMEAHEMNSINNVKVYYCRNANPGGGVPMALARLETSERVSLEAVPCCGRIDPRYMLKAFETGVDAIGVLACPSGDCRLMEGNLRAEVRVNTVRKMLSEIGVDPDIRQIFVPSRSSDEARYAAAQAAADFARDAGRVSREVLVAQGR